MTSKQRNFLRALAVNYEPVVTIGKQGLSESVLAELNDVLDNRELVKVSVLKNAPFEPKEILNEAAAALNAESIAAIGGKIVLYRRSDKKDVKHIEIPD